MGFRSGEYLGRKRRRAPAALMARRTALLLCEPRFVRAEIVRDHDVARPQGGDEDLVDVEPEGLAVDGPVEQPRRLDPIVPQGGQEGHRLPVTVRHLGLEALSARRPAPERGHVGLGPGLVDEDEAGRVDELLPARPLRPPARHVGAALLGRDQRLFL